MEIERKKVAVVVTGHMRTFKLHFKDFKKRLLDLHDCDLYLSTWDRNIVGSMLGGNLSKWQEEDIRNALSIYPNVKKIIIGHYNKIDSECNDYINAFGELGTCPDPLYKKYIGGRAERKTMPYNAGQWWPVQEGFRAIENPEQYDVVMRTRFDIHLYKPVRFLPNEICAVHPGPKFRPGSNIKQTALYTIKNHIFYGKPYLVEIMKNIYNKNLEVSCKFNDLATDSLLEWILRNNDRGYELTVDENFRESVEYGVWK
jgi:hypothetical protein